MFRSEIPRYAACAEKKSVENLTGKETVDALIFGFFCACAVFPNLLLPNVLLIVKVTFRRYSLILSWLSFETNEFFGFRFL